MTNKKLEEALEKGAMSVFWYALPRFLIVVLVLSVVFFTYSLIANPFVQAKRIFDKTIDADNVIYNYEWFKSRHEDIIAIDKKIVEAKKSVERFKIEAGDRSNWSREDKIESGRLNSISDGLGQQRADLVSEYNAKSRMANRSIFKAGDVELPERIEQ